MKFTHRVDRYALDVDGGTLTATIYVLCDSREADPVKRVRYVGRTIRTLKERLRNHWKIARRRENVGRADWMRVVQAAGGDILIEAIRTVPVAECDEAEMAEIARHRALGCRLLNHTDGGGGMVNPPIEVREKIAATLRARVLSADELTAKRTHAARYWHSVEAKAKSLARRQTPEYRAAHRAIKLMPEALARASAMGQANIGRKMSSETCAQMARSHTGIRPSEVTRQKMCAWQRGAGSHRAKLTTEQVETIRSRHAMGDVSQHQLAREHKVTPRTINLIVHRKTWTNV